MFMIIVVSSLATRGDAAAPTVPADCHAGRRDSRMPQAADHKEKGTAAAVPFAADSAASAYRRVVHVELDRMGRHAEARDFLHLQLDVGVDVGVGEHAALGQERAVLVQVVERLVEAVADGRDLRVFFRRQVVQVLGRGFARMDLVLDAVQAGHQQRREAEVRVGQRIREARLDAAALRVRPRTECGSRPSGCCAE